MHRDIQRNLEGYLFTALTRKIYNYWRHEIIHNNCEAAIEYKGVPAERDAAANMEYAELQQDLEQQIEKLPTQCQKIFRLKKESQYTNKEIAEHLGISVKTVEAQMTKALRILRTHFDYYSVAGLLLTVYEVMNNN